MFMNNRVAPFDDPKVREAVNIGLDKVALAKLFAGEMAPGCTFLPPGCPATTRRSTRPSARGATRTRAATSRPPSR